MLKRLLLSSAISAIIAAALPFYSCALWVNAQYFVSTRAGFVNRVRGKVFVQRAGGEEREPVSPNLQMTDGDRLYTSAESRVEILVNSQAYLRLDEQAEVRAVNTVLTEARFELLRGTAMVEVARMDKSIVFELVTPHGTVAISKEGFCRISIGPSSTRIEVIEGEIALGTRQEAVSKRAVKIEDGKRVELTSDRQAAPVITALERRPFDEFDNWSFQVARYGVVRRLEADVYTACRGQEPSELCRVSTEFQLKEDEWLFTDADSYVELRLNRAGHLGSTNRAQLWPHRELSLGVRMYLGPWFTRGVYLCLNQKTRLQAVKTETDETVFQLQRGSVIVVADRYTSMRPLKISTPDGAFLIERGCIARFDVNPAQTIVSVRQGEVRMETGSGSATKGAKEIGRGQRLYLTGGASPSQRIEKFEADLQTAGLDAFDRWSFHLAAAGYVSRYEGKVAIERRSGTKLELDKYPRRTQVQLWEGDRLITAPGGRAEVLLSSRTVMHVNEESEIRAVNTEVSAPRFELLRGTAYLYLWNAGVAHQRLWTLDSVFKKAKVELSTPHGLASIAKNGSYRFEVAPPGTTIKVHSGALFLGTQEEAKARTALKVSEQETAYLTGTRARPPEIVKLAASPPDDFDHWSRLLLEHLISRFRQESIPTVSMGPGRSPSPIRF
jgi:ferric-dicitrate binding protein FerR (iron transport regulator)